jgi:hypothetical protein
MAGDAEKRQLIVVTDGVADEKRKSGDRRVR